MQPRHARSRRSPGVVGVGGPVLAVVLLATLSGLGVVLARDTEDDEPVMARLAAPGASGPPAVRASVVADVVGRGPAAEAAAVLRAWDRARAEAWARGSPAGLRRLYVAGAGAADLRMLRSYLDRGLRVHGMRTQLLALEVLDRRRDHWRIRVTDRLAGGVAVGAGGSEPLPRDEASIRVLSLVNDGGRWRVAVVR
jgi:hypothetical protein